MNSQDPTEQHVAAILADVFRMKPIAVGRFTTGNQHFVFDAVLASGRKVVVRLSRVCDTGIAGGAVFWSHRLRPLGVPLPELLHVDLDRRFHSFPFIVLERLPGSDLGAVYDDMTSRERRLLTRQLFEIQRLVTSQPEAAGFGFAPSEKGPFSCRTWADVLAADLARGRRRIRAACVVDERKVDRVEKLVESFDDYLSSVRPTPFLHDITTKNVIVDQGKLSGIVDVDDLCFGDPLYLLGLIRVALSAHGRDATYVDDWLDLLQPTDQQASVLDLYTAVHCVGFMGELGNRFNNAAPEPVNTDVAARLDRLHHCVAG